MGKDRLIWVGLAAALSLSLGVATPQEPSPATILKSLATDDVDFRACDRDWNQPSEVPSASAADLTDARTNDRDWCNVIDYPTANSTEPPQVLSLKDFPAEEFDFRGCDGGRNRVDDFWSTNVADLFKLYETGVEESED
jgi:hypothetical protein